MLLLLALTTALADTPAPAEEIAETIAVPNTDLLVHVPKGEGPIPDWAWSTGDITNEVKLGMRNRAAFTDIRLRTTGYQPDPHKVADDLLRWVQEQDENDEYQEYTLGEMELSEHEVLGPIVRLPFTVFDTHMEQTFYDELVMFASHSIGVIVTSISSDSAERSHEVLESMIAMIENPRPAVPAEELPTGSVTSTFGLEVDLPVGWRALTEEELMSRNTELVRGESSFFGNPANFYVVDESKLSSTLFSCNASDGSSMFIVDPEKSEQARQNIDTWARVALEGGLYQVTTDKSATGGEEIPDHPMSVEQIEKIEWITLGDREGYLVHAHGTVWDEPREASLFYTAWDDLGITCIAMADPEENASLETFERVMRGASVVDSANHPMPMSTATRYARWWPYSHPALQLYWLPIPLILLSGLFVYKSD